MDIHYTPEPETESSAKLHAYLTELLRPSIERMAEKDRVTDLLFDAIRDGDRAKFHALWIEHVLPLASEENPAVG